MSQEHLTNESGACIEQLLRRYDITLIDASAPWDSVNAGIFLQKDMWVRITRRGGGWD